MKNSCQRKMEFLQLEPGIFIVCIIRISHCSPFRVISIFARPFLSDISFPSGSFAPVISQDISKAMISFVIYLIFFPVIFRVLFLNTVVKDFSRTFSMESLPKEFIPRVLVKSASSEKALLYVRASCVFQALDITSSNAWIFRESCTICTVCPEAWQI